MKLNHAADIKKGSPVEVTTEMINAGRDALFEFSMVDLADGWQRSDEVVIAIFRAMLLARQEDQSLFR